MDIENLTIGEARQIAAMFAPTQSAPTKSAPPCPHIGQRVIIRGYASGVHYGILAAHHERQVTLHQSRRMWRWFANGGISLSEVALNGLGDGDVRLQVVLPKITILDAIEIIPCSPGAIKSIDAQPVYVP